MRWTQVLFSQGFGTRRECEALLRAARVRHLGRVVEDADGEVDPAGLEFEVAGQRVVGERHLRLRLRHRGRLLEAMLFGHAEPLPERLLAGYRLSANHYNGAVSLQLILDRWQAA